MNLLPILLLLASGLFFQANEDHEVMQGIAFFEKGDFKNAQKYLSNSLPRARDVAHASWCLALADIAISNNFSEKEKAELLTVALGLFENLAITSSPYALGAAIGYNDCMLVTFRVGSLPQILKANVLLKNALKTPWISNVDVININLRINYNAFLIAQYENSADEIEQGRGEGGDKNQGDKNSQSKSSEGKNKVGVSDKDADKSKGKKTNKKAEAFTDKVQAGKGNLDLIPYRGSLQNISKEDAAELIRDAAKKVRQASGEYSP